MELASDAKGATLRQRLTHAGRMGALACTFALALTCAQTGLALAEENEGASSTVDDTWSAYAPRVVDHEDGTQTQQTPDSTTQHGYFVPTADWNGYNNYVFNADNRGCTSCHDLENTLKSMGHVLYKGAYDGSTMVETDCTACHVTYGIDIQEHMHSVHMNSEVFTAMNGSCMSCHYADDDGNMVLWDDVKYDVMNGITDIAADEAAIDVTWDQNEVTPANKMFTVTYAEAGYEAHYIPRSDDILNEYTVKFYGDMDNEREMSIQEMIDEFGTETRLQTNACTINGQGGPLIYQAEVKGIPLNKVLDSLCIHDDAKFFDAIGVDGYDHAVYTYVVRASNPLLVYEMNGEPLTDEQGYPCAIWMDGGMSAGLSTRYVSEIRIAAEPTQPPMLDNGFYKGIYGDYLDPHTGEAINTPNMGVLTSTNGTIFPSGSDVHLEGYAFAFDETVTRLEFSLDRGQTWIEIPTNDTDNERWVYWKMNLSGLEQGPYVLTMRATSLNDDGTQSTMAVNPKFLINVQ